MCDEADSLPVRPRSMALGVDPTMCFRLVLWSVVLLPLLGEYKEKKDGRKRTDWGV